MNKSFQLSLKKLRKSRGFNQSDLAAHAGMNEKYYQRIETGKSSPTLEKFFDLCNALDISPSEFMLYIERNNS